MFSLRAVFEQTPNHRFKVQIRELIDTAFIKEHFMKIRSQSTKYFDARAITVESL
jgi:hypothetical protein